MESTKSKKQSIKVIISEAIMFLAVVATVIILALLVSGYWLNSNFQVERNGMLQISSLPTGADVEIDGKSSSWLERTNSSKILGSGEHTVTLTKDGYDSWSKTVNISEGLLYRLHYPRLFLDNRTASSVINASEYDSATISASRNIALLMNSTTEWALLNLDTDDPKLQPINVSKLFNSVTSSDDSAVNRFTGRIISADWDHDASHILFKVADGDAVEWVLLDINNVDKSINITKEFGADFSQLSILDNNSNNLLAIQNHNLRKIDIPGRLISAILVQDVENFDHYHNEIVFSAVKSDSVEEEGDLSSSGIEASDSGDSETVQPDSSKYYVGYFKLGDTKPTILESTDSPAMVTISQFYDSKYITVVEGQNIYVHEKDAFKERVSKYSLSFLPDKVKVGHAGEFLIFTKQQQIGTLDMEGKLIHEWVIEGEDHGWLDDDMLYAVNDAGELIVYDFDGLNRRVIARDVSNSFPVSITSDKWLYYFRNHTLMREWLIPR